MTTRSARPAVASFRKRVSLSPGSASGGFGPTTGETRMMAVRRDLLLYDLPFTEAIARIVDLENELQSLRQARPAKEAPATAPPRAAP